MKVCIIGTGYVGLVAAACFASTGNEVIGADIDEAKIGVLNAGEVPIYEPGLQSLIGEGLEHGRLKFTTDVAAAVRSSDVIFIAVGTPQGEDGAADLTHVMAVAEVIGVNIRDGAIVVDKSTVPVGTAEAVQKRIEQITGKRFPVVSNPEFLKEGAAIEDFMKPDRVVIGTQSAHSMTVMAQLYAPFTRNSRVIYTDQRSAEMIKYAANAMLAVRISFMNEIANLCESVGANADEVRLGVGSDSRIGPAFLYPGPGYGGSCFPKDVKAIVTLARQHRKSLSVIEAAENANEYQKGRLFDKLQYIYGHDLPGKRIAVWGLAFKPRTDDMREAPSLKLVAQLLGAGCTVTVHDPAAMDEAFKHFRTTVGYADDPYKALEGADALVIVTDWHEYRSPDFDRIHSTLSGKFPVVVDGRNLYDPREMSAKGFKYYSFGRSVR